MILEEEIRAWRARVGPIMLALADASAFELEAAFEAAAVRARAEVTIRTAALANGTKHTEGAVATLVATDPAVQQVDAALLATRMLVASAEAASKVLTAEGRALGWLVILQGGTSHEPL